jgi:hypothetical protein
VWRATYGEVVASGIDVCHACDNPSCCRPDHLFLGTRSDNMQDMHAKGRYPASRRGNFRRGSATSWSKLTETDVRTIRTDAAAGTSTSTLARRYGVNRTTIEAAVHKKTWRHVG